MVARHRGTARVHCEILVAGPVKASWLDQVSELALINAQSEFGPICVLRGDVEDQAALMGVLNGLDALGLSLLSVACSAIEPAAAP